MHDIGEDTETVYGRKGIIHLIAEGQTVRREKSMKFAKISAVVAACALAVTLVACGGASTYSQVTLDEAVGIKAEAERGTKDQVSTTEGALVVKEGDMVVISPDVTKGSFHLTITASDTGTVVFDGDVDGRVLFTQAIEPGTYDVTTYGNDVTGALVVAVHNQEEWAAQDAALADALGEAGVELDTEADSSN